MGAFGALLIGFSSGFVISLGIMHLLTLGSDQKEAVPLDEVVMHSPNEEFHRNEDVIANKLAEKVRVLCVVFLSQRTLDKAKHLRQTWIKHCNAHSFFSNVDDKEIPVIKLPLENSKGCKWQRLKAMLKYVYLYQLKSIDWVLIADERTYVIVENLRYMLSDQNAWDPVYFGRRLSSQDNNYTMLSSNAGFVLSKETVRKLVLEGFLENKCNHMNQVGSVDLEIGKCLERIGAQGVDTRDSLGRGRFFPFPPLAQLTSHGSYEYSFWKASQQEQKGFNCCSDLAITFHSYDVLDMYIMEYLVYHVRPYGIKHNSTVILNRRNDDNSSTAEPTSVGL